MLVVEAIGRIRREHFVQGKSIKEIARALKLSRNTVRKVLRSDDTSFSYERQVQPRPKLGRWKEELDRLLATNSETSARERLTLIRIFEELRAHGYEGGYDAVRRYASAWAKTNASAAANAFVPLTFAPGEAYQFAWSHEIVVMDGVTVGERRRPPRRHPRLRRSDRCPPGWTHGGRAPAVLRPRQDDLRSLALRAGSGAQAGRSAQWSAVQGLGVAGGARSGAAQGLSGILCAGP